MGVVHQLERILVALERRVGYVGDLITTGRRSARPRSVTVGFVRDRDETILIAASALTVRGRQISAVIRVVSSPCVAARVATWRAS